MDIRLEIEKEIICNVARNKTPAMKPIMSAQLEQDVLSAVQQYIQAPLWKEWGLTYLRKQGSSILLYGPPGCGKGEIANYLAKLVGKPVLRFGMGEVGGGKPGDTERAIRELFTEAARSKKTVFMDECEAVLYDRATIHGENRWMIGVIDELLKQLSEYKGLTLLATNNKETLDPALDRRLLATIYVGKPELPERIKLWKQKMPKSYPLKLTEIQIREIATIPLTGAEIENAILRESGYAILQKRLPNFEHLCNVAKAESKVQTT